MRMELEGWDALKPHEMVELVLYHAVPRQDFSDAARALIENTELPAAEIAGKALKIASDICVYTNGNIIVETV